MAWAAEPANHPLLPAVPEGYYLHAYDDLGIESLAGDELILTAQAGQPEGRGNLSRKGLFFTPIHFRPVPASTAGLDNNCLNLDGEWQMNPAPDSEARTRPLTQRHCLVHRQRIGIQPSVLRCHQSMPGPGSDPAHHVQQSRFGGQLRGAGH